MRDIFVLYRRGVSDVARIIDAKIPTEISKKEFYDLTAPNGKRIDVKATVVRGNQQRARFSLNRDANGTPLKKRIDYLVCVAYDSDSDIKAILAIPAKALPDWETTFGISLKPQINRRAIKWLKYRVKQNELHDMFNN
jgi:hypothetical protein